MESDENQKRSYDEITQTLPKGKGWWFEHLVQYKGFWFPKYVVRRIVEMDENLFKPKPTDVILATSPKCGTTWLRAIVFTIINRNQHGFDSHPLLTLNPRVLVPFFEGTPLNQPSSLLSTHLPYTIFPDSVSGSGCKFVYVSRDPKDVFVSMFCFMEKLRPKELPPLSFEDAFEMFCEGVTHFGSFWDHVLTYWEASLKWPEKVLFLKYEDIQMDPCFYVKRLAEFLGCPFSIEEECEKVVEKVVKLCSFETLSNLEVNKGRDSPSIGRGGFIKNEDFFRKGIVGDWKNVLTYEMVERLDRITKEKLFPRGLTFASSGNEITRDGLDA